ncbi:hypothetical protein [Ralstonia pseudosolanacearum]|uniref:hypothetical protein n=1 Tax=Ralstonia pseudosolanacearum TaxID=1310165 RepID=UPI000A68BF50|nr:hypothetical protein [Ralstonia pseudosolanacearum]MDO3558291.1 hypothetical protein [Ralstonia pseudosolanacearum]MDO3575516.1 hypothetical protein [Ralstonia pseudosolanacearum]MDO3586888.1 hypothetical protein [Ralstonia pseudosolanacearum]
MSDVKIHVGAEIDSADIDKQIAKLTQQINRLGITVAQANKVKFNPVDRATLADLQKVQAAFEGIKRLSPNLAADLNRTGQGSAHFADLDLTRLSNSPFVAAARAYGLFNKVAAGTPWAASMQQSTAGGTGGHPPAPPSPPPTPGASWGWGGAGRRILGAGLNAAGPVGQAVNGGISAGISAGVMAGVGGFVGMLGAALVGKAVGAVKEKIGDAQNDAIGYDSLKRILGDVNVSFDVLKSSLHAASDAIDVNYDEVRKLGTEFAKTSGISGDLSKTLAEEVRVGGTFGRSFGVDPGQSNAFFAQMRQFGVTRNPDDSRKLALDIGEAIAKSGAFSKADEMLQAIGSYTAQQTRLGLTAANSTGYAGMLTGLVGSHTPGLDPQGAASLLARVNSAIANGGAAGEAGQNFLYMALGKRLGLNPIQSKLLQEQGAFGSGSQTFGSGSLYAKWAAQNGLAIPGAAGSGETNLEMTLKALRLNYANPMLRLSAMSSLLGVNTNQAMAMDAVNPEKLGGLQRMLATSGVDLTKMRGDGINALAQISTGGRDVLNAQTKALWGQLSPDEAARLDKAGKGGDEELRKALIQLTAAHGQEETEGEKTRESINKLDKTTQDAAAKMIGPLNTMRDTLLYAFGDRGRMTAADMHKAVVDAQRQEVNDRYGARVKKAQASASMSVDEYGRTLPGQEAAMKAAQDEMAAAKLERDNALREIDAGETPATASTNANNTALLPAWASQAASSPGTSGPRNLRNNNPGNIEYGAWAKAHGATGSDGRFAVFPDAATGSAAVDALLQNYGNRGLNTVSGVIGRWAPASENDTSGYAATVAKRLGVGANDRLNMADPAVRQALGREIARYEGSAAAYNMYNTPLPEGASRAAQQSQQQIEFKHHIVLEDKAGKPVAPVSVVSTRVSRPSPSGSAN